MKYKRLGVEDHIELGGELKFVREIMRNSIQNPIYSSHRKAEKSRKLIEKLVKGLDRLRCELENEMFYDAPSLPDSAINIYYGKLSNYIPKAGRYKRGEKMMFT